MAPRKTPDGRYIIVDGRAGPRLWRATDPNLPEDERQRLVDELMEARRAVKAARGDADRLGPARKRVDCAKQRLGERGPVWWTDKAPDLNRTLVDHSPYREWWRQRTGLGQES